MPEESTKNIDFALSEDKNVSQERSSQKIFNWVIKEGTKILILTEILVILLLATRVYLEKDLENITKKTARAEKSYKQYKEIESKHAEILPSIKFLEEIEEEKIDLRARIRNFNNRLPSSSILNSLGYDENGFQFEASIQDAVDFGFLISELIKDEKISAIQLRKSSFNTKEKRYEIDLIVEYKKG